MSIVRRSKEEVQQARPRLDVHKVESATESDIARWKRQEGIDDTAWGRPRLVRAGPDVRRIREHLGLSQEDFAERFHLSPRTVQEWEQHRRVPEGPARVLLQVIEREPAAAARALAGCERP